MTTTEARPDPGGHPSEPDTTTELTHRQILLVFAGLMSGMLLAALDGTIFATALPTIVGDLGGLSQLSWVVTAYLLTSTASTPLYGKISDVYGRKVVFQAAIVIFLAGSLFAGVSQTMTQLVLSRGVQGIGAGGLMAMAFAIVGDVVAPSQRGRYTGYLGAVFAVASVAGPLMGGFFVDHLTWRWAFLVNLPVGIAALVVTTKVLRLAVVRQRHRIDYEGAVLLVAGVTCILLGLVWGGNEHPWGSPTIVGLFAGGVVLSALFVWWETRADEPLLPLRLFKDDIFTVGTVLLTLAGVGMFGALVYMPVYLQVVKGASATESGLQTVPLMAGIMITSIGTGRLISKTGRYRTWPIVGLAISAVGTLLLSTMGTDTSQLEASLWMFVLGFGIGMVMQVVILAVQNSAAQADLGVVTSSATFFRTMGGALGVAVYGAIFSSRLTAELTAGLAPGAADRLGGASADLINSPESIRALPAEVSTTVIDAVSSSLSTVFLAATPVFVAGTILAFFLREKPLRTSTGPATLAEGAEEALLPEVIEAEVTSRRALDEEQAAT